MTRFIHAVPLAAQIKEVRRELALRERVYPGWITSGRIKNHDAIMQIDALRAVLATLLMVQEAEAPRLL